jgi:O-succinylbenzoic acid--CoA ligase
VSAGRWARAVILPPGPRLHRALADALDGTGPAICPLSPELPAPALSSLLDALAPAEVETAGGVTRREGVPVEPGTAVLVATSGSTGTPKIVELSADALVASASATLRRVEAGPGDRWLCTVPTSHIAGIQVLVRALVSGTEPIIHERFDPRAVMESEPAHVSLVPTQLRRLVDSGADLSRPLSILLGGGPVPADLLEQARAEGARIFTTYGMSETCGGCVYNGVPLDGVSVAVGDDGRIRLAGPSLFTGYRLRPDLTAEVRDGDWFLTQDLGTLTGDGLLRVRGRLDDVINTGGKKVVAGEVQALLARHPAVRDVVVLGCPDPEWGEIVTAFVVPEDPAAPVTLDEVRAWVRAALPVECAPRALEVIASMPLLPSGKPDRATLRNRRQANIPR